MPGSKHSPEFRAMVSQEYIDGEGTVDDITARYGISSRSILRRWIMEYNANRELKDYNPKQGSIWQKHGEKQRLKNAKRLSVTV